jgi:uncharacterized protein YciI
MSDAKYYVILARLNSDGPPPPDVLDRHTAHLAKLDQEGKLVLAGPIPERKGGLIVIRAADLAEAKAIAERDPFVQGKYETYELGTWLMSNRENGYRPAMPGAHT